jgi:hypothetical protein
MFCLFLEIRELLEKGPKETNTSFLAIATNYPDPQGHYTSRCELLEGLFSIIKSQRRRAWHDIVTFNEF